MSNSSNASVTAYCAMFNDDLFTQAYNKLSASTLKATCHRKGAASIPSM